MNRRVPLSLLVLAVLPAAGQNAPDLSALAPGYAQLLSLPTEADISSATYQITDDAGRYAVHVSRLPATFRVVALAPGLDLNSTLSAGYLKMTQVIDTELGTVAARWRTYSLTGGLGLRAEMSDRWTLTASTDLGVARLDNHATYTGLLADFRSQMDGLVFNWHTNAWILTPSLGVQYFRASQERSLLVKAHVARSWISSFHALHPSLNFQETAQTLSLEGEQTWDTGIQLKGQPLRLLALGGFFGFFGSNRDVLGFTSLSKLGLGLEVPLAGRLKRLGQLRLSGAYILGPELRGWTFGLSLVD